MLARESHRSHCGGTQGAGGGGGRRPRLRPRMGQLGPGQRLMEEAKRISAVSGSSPLRTQRLARLPRQ